LLDDLLSRRCDEYTRAYANILYAWQLLDQRAEILKHQSSKEQVESEIGFASQCRKCMEVVNNSPSCQKSSCFAFICSVCNLGVRGDSLYHFYTPFTIVCVYRKFLFLSELRSWWSHYPHAGVVWPVLSVSHWLWMCLYRGYKLDLINNNSTSNY